MFGEMIGIKQSPNVKGTILNPPWDQNITNIAIQ
jgi:hypothetical protein